MFSTKTPLYVGVFILFVFYSLYGGYKPGGSKFIAIYQIYAATHNVDLSLDIDAQQATLTIKDDGRGFPPDAENQPGHYGLRGMRERVEGLGGTLTFSGNGNGSRVDVKLPVL